MAGSVFELLSLPARVLCDVLGENVSLKCLVLLDSAFCQRSKRQNWLKFLSSNQLTSHGKVVLTAHSASEWLLKRLLKISSVEFSTESNFQNESEYLRLCGSSIRKVRFAASDWHFGMTIVALYCKNIVVLRLSGMCVSIALRHLLWSNPNIRELWFDHLTCSDTGVFASMSLDALHLLHVMESASLDAFSWDESTACKNLRTLVLRNSTSTTYMRNFMINYTVTSVSVNSCNYMSPTALVNVCLEGSPATDVDVLLFAERLPSLRTFSIRNCTRLTDVSLQHIANINLTNILLVCCQIDICV